MPIADAGWTEGNGGRRREERVGGHSQHNTSSGAG